MIPGAMEILGAKKRDSQRSCAAFRLGGLKKEMVRNTIFSLKYIK
jgi:hypothetical protein